MGLMIHSLEGLPDQHLRDYYIYLLDYGWKEPLGESLRKNFDKMATLSSKRNDTVVIINTDEGIHFSDEVLSWHSINGDDAKKNKLLPAILITNRHPKAFRDRSSDNWKSSKSDEDFKMILLPLKKHCKNTSDVVNLIQLIFQKISEGKDLNEFKIATSKKKSFIGGIVTSIVLEPNVAGIGFSFNKLMSYFSDKD